MARKREYWRNLIPVDLFYFRVPLFFIHPPRNEGEPDGCRVRPAESRLLEEMFAFRRQLNEDLRLGFMLSS